MKQITYARLIKSINYLNYAMSRQCNIVRILKRFYRRYRCHQGSVKKTEAQQSISSRHNSSKCNITCKGSWVEEQRTIAHPWTLGCLGFDTWPSPLPEVQVNDCIEKQQSVKSILRLERQNIKVLKWSILRHWYFSSRIMYVSTGKEVLGDISDIL